MKKKLLLSIDEKLYKTIKHISVEEGATCSELVELFMRNISKNKNTLKALRDLDKK